jgi:hypothetical protein
MGGQVGLGQVVQTVVGVGGTVMSSYAAGQQADYMNQLMSEGAGTRARAQGIDEYFLGGGQASELDVPGFSDQFGQVDFALEQQLMQIDDAAREARQQISEGIPSGGAKLRALAELAQSAQDQKAAAIREAQATKRDLDVRLTNAYTRAAMGRNYGPSQDARLWAASRDYENRIGDINAISQSLGSLAGRAFDNQQDQQPKKQQQLLQTKSGQNTLYGSSW